MKPEELKKIAIKMINQKGLINLSRAGLCEEAGIPAGSFPLIAGCNFTQFVKELKSEIKPANNIVHKVSKRRVSSELRRDHILDVAIELAKVKGYKNVPIVDIAEKAGISTTLILHHFNTLIQLRRAIIRTAVQREILEIIAQGLSIGDTHARKASSEVKLKAIQLLATL